MPAADGSVGGGDFKDRISTEAVTGLAADLAAVHPGFDRGAFVRKATAGLDELELKARVVQVADALAANLPPEFGEAAAVIDRAIARPTFEGWIVFPVDDWVARYGIDHPDTALPLLGRLTSRWTAEYAIRPFIETHRSRTFKEFDRWIESEDEHLRRLVSEGSRPRLPWATQLRCFIEDPAPTIRLLGRLVDDPSVYVRKSVANHLGDIAKDHPDLAVDTATRWVEANPESACRRWIASHGLRSLVKAGDPEALRLLGYDPDAPVGISAFDVGPARIRIGEAVKIEFVLTAGPGAGAEPVPVMVDYLIHHAGARGSRGPKAFKLKRTELKPGVETAFRKEHQIRQVTVRRIHLGPHRIEVQVNGNILAAATIQVNS
jgi:3-methyladenine DNA glycosylase AlkC